MTPCRTATAIAVLALAAAVAPAPAAVRLAPAGARVHALAVAPDGRAHAVVDSGRTARPFAVVRSSGGGRPKRLGAFGELRAAFPDVAVHPGGAVRVVWGAPIADGVAVRSATPRGGAERTLAYATGPASLLLPPGQDVVLAHPDRDGNAALATRGPRGAATERLTGDAPEVRHHVLDAVTGPDGPLALDLAQRPGRSELRVLGAGAPREPVTSVGALRHVPGTIAASSSTVAVAYAFRGRTVLATARPNGAWRARRLPGRGAGSEAPGVVVDGNTVVVAYARRAVGARRDVVAFVGRPGDGRVVRLGTHPRDEGGVLAARGAAGDVFVAWNREHRGGAVPVLRRLG